MHRSENFYFRRIGETQFLKSKDQNDTKLVFLNNTSAFLWGKMKDQFTEEGLVNALIAEYDVQKEEASRDVNEFLSFLLEKGCLVVEVPK